MRKAFLISIPILLLFVFSISIVCISYAGIRVKPHGKDIILSPGEAYIVSETVVENGELVSDRIIQTEVQKVKVKPKPNVGHASSPKASKVGKVLRRWGVRLLDMFVCNVDVD